MLTKLRGLLSWAVLLVLGLGLVASARSPSTAEDAEIRTEVLKLAQAIEKGSEGTQSQAEAIAKKVELEDVMGLFRLRTKKGIGVGVKPGAIKPDGIEAQIMNLGKRELRKDQLAIDEVLRLDPLIGEPHGAHIPQIAMRDPTHCPRERQG